MLMSDERCQSVHKKLDELMEKVRQLPVPTKNFVRIETTGLP